MDSGTDADSGTGLCAETLAELRDVFGPERLDGLLQALAEEIERRLVPVSDDRETLRSDAHAMVSVSGALGFDALARACAELERACLEGAPAREGAAVAAVEAEARRALAALAGLVPPRARTP